MVTAPISGHHALTRCLSRPRGYFGSGGGSFQLGGVQQGDIAAGVGSVPSPRIRHIGRKTLATTAAAQAE